MKTHYDPYSDEPEQAACGTWLGESSNITGDWGTVDCKKCLACRERIAGAVDRMEKLIVDQMGDMANFMSRIESNQ